jgi:hypothetical protein
VRFCEAAVLLLGCWILRNDVMVLFWHSKHNRNNNNNNIIISKCHAHHDNNSPVEFRIREIMDVQSRSVKT